MSSFIDEYGKIIIMVIIAGALITLGGVFLFKVNEMDLLSVTRESENASNRPSVVLESRQFERFSAPSSKVLTYTGSSQELVYAGNSSTGTVVYSLDNVTFSEDIPTGTEVGHYDVYYKTILDDGSYSNAGELKVDILKGISAIDVEPTVKNLLFTGAAQNAATEGSSPDGYFVYSLDGQNFDTVMPTVTNSGSYTFYYKLIGDDNHVGTSVQTVNFVVDTEYTNNMTPPIANILTYTGSSQTLIQPGLAGNGTMVYSLDGLNFSENLPSAVDAGQYDVFYKVEGDTNGSVGCVSAMINRLDCSIVTHPSVKNLVYNGELQELINPGVFEGGTIQYSVNGSEYSTDIPVGIKAGSYDILYKAIGDSNHTNSGEFSMTVVIDKATVMCSEPTPKNLEYDGSAQELIEPCESSFGFVEYSLDGVTFDRAVPTAINAGKYTVYYRVLGDDNHYDTSLGNIVVTIDKTTTEYTAPVAKLGLIWNGEPQVLIDEGFSDHGVFEYSLDGKEYSKDIPQATSAGTYVINYKVIGDVNHKNVGPYTINANIAGLKDIEVVCKDGNAVFTGEPTHGDASVNVITPSSGYELWYGMTEGNYNMKSVPEFTDAGSYTIYYCVKAYGYTTLTGSINLSIEKPLPTYTVTPATGLVYNGTSQCLIHYSDAKNCTIKYSLDNIDFQPTLPRAMNAGTYRVYYQVEGDMNYQSVLGLYYDVTIEKHAGTLTITDEIYDLVYNGTSQQLFESVCTSTTGRVEYSLDNENWSTVIPSGTDAGKYDVYVRSVSTKDNYKDVLPEDNKPQIVVNIQKANIEYEPPVAIEDLYYNGTEQELIIAGSNNHGTMQYRLKDTEYSTTIPTAINAGGYSVFYRIVGDKNYNDVEEQSLLIGINQIDFEYTPPVAKKLKYTGKPQELFEPGTTEIGEMHYMFPASTWGTDILKATDAGVYKCHYTVIHNNINYKPISTSSYIEVYIEHLPAQLTAPTAKTGLVYNGNNQALISPGSSSTGTVYYSINEGRSWSTEIPTAVNAGTYKVYYYTKGRPNYSSSPKTDYITVTIDKDDGYVSNATARTLYANGSFQRLITAATSTTGTVYYKVGEDGDWSTSIPTRKVAGTYTVYYYSKGDSNHYDSAVKSVTAKIQ